MTYEGSRVMKDYKQKINTLIGNLRTEMQWHFDEVYEQAYKKGYAAGYDLGYKEGIEKKSEKQSKTGHWIPVSEKLPDKEGHYLCSVRYMYPPYNFFEPEKVKYMDDVTIQKFDGEFNIEVKAWMPLPEPYIAESEV